MKYIPRIVVLTTIMLTLFVCGCKSKVPKPIDYNKTASIKVGMSYKDVVKILGTEGIDQTPNGQIYIWDFHYGSKNYTGQAKLFFNNGKYIGYATTGFIPGDFGLICELLDPEKDSYKTVVQKYGKDAGTVLTGGKSYIWKIVAPGRLADGTSYHVLFKHGKVIEKDEKYTPCSPHFPNERNSGRIDK